MNLFTGTIDRIWNEDGVLKAKVTVRGAMRTIALLLPSEPRIGDRVLVESGVAVAKVENPERKET